MLLERFFFPTVQTCQFPPLGMCGKWHFVVPVDIGCLGSASDGGGMRETQPGQCKRLTQTVLFVIQKG